MATSLSTNCFLGFTCSDSLSEIGSCQSVLTKLPSPSLQIPLRRNSPRLVVQATGSTFGSHFRVTTYGEAHGGGVGCVIDGCPPRLQLSEEDLQIDLDRRGPSQS